MSLPKSGLDDAIELDKAKTQSMKLFILPAQQIHNKKMLLKLVYSNHPTLRRSNKDDMEELERVKIQLQNRKFV